jgi:hypothetical protein
MLTVAGNGSAILGVEFWVLNGGVAQRCAVGVMARRNERKLRARVAVGDGALDAVAEPFASQWGIKENQRASAKRKRSGQLGDETECKLVAAFAPRM